MRQYLKIKDIHSLRKYLLHQATGDTCIAEKYSHLLAFQLPRKGKEETSHLNKTSVKLISHTKHIPFSIKFKPQFEQPSVDISSSTKGPSSEGKPKKPVTDFYIDYNTFKSSVIRTVLGCGGNQGTDSELHRYHSNENGESKKHRKRNIVIDFSSPNIAKPFHAGHLRSTVIGNFIANIHSALGDNVTRINYLGDWGTQFGLLTTGYKTYGDETQLGENAIQHLYELYVKMNKLAEADPGLMEEAQHACLQLEQGDEELMMLWKKFRQCSIENYSTIYKRLGVKFDTHEWESDQHISAKAICQQLKTQGKLREMNGAYGVNFTTKNDKIEEIILLKGNGSTLYITRDIAALLSRYQRYKFDKMLYVVDVNQVRHFRHLKGVVSDLDLFTDDKNPNNLMEHVKFGRVKGMSTRRGQAVFLSDILDEARDRMIEKMKESHTTQSGYENIEIIADSLSTTAVIVSDLKLSRVKNYSFNWDDVLSFTGNTGPFLQITHARLCSLERNCGIDLNTDATLDNLVESECVRLITHLAKYDEAIGKAASQYESHHLVRYLFDLCHFSNAAFKKLAVKNQEKTVAEDRLVMFHCARLTIANGLRLLGITPIKSI